MSADGTLSAEQEAAVLVVAAALVNAPAPVTAADRRVAHVAMVQACEYAPDAPLSIQTEGAIRMAGSLKEARPGFSDWSMEGADSTKLTRTRAGSNALRGSAASALLARWRVRRASAAF